MLPDARDDVTEAAAQPGADDAGSRDVATPADIWPPADGEALNDPGPRAVLGPVADGRARIGQLADELLPALIARLSASSLGELEVREASWRVRLRRAPVPTEPESAPTGRARTGMRHPAPASDGTDGASASSTPAARGAGQPATLLRDGGRVHAMSPAVGYYSPREGMGVGQQVRAGDVLGHIDVLGVRQEVVSPSDGLVTRQLAEAGEAVEYGQELVRLERFQKAAARQTDDNDGVTAPASPSIPRPPTLQPSTGMAATLSRATTNGAAYRAAPVEVPGKDPVATTGAAPDAATS